jgi:hypothetical protein
MIASSTSKWPSNPSKLRRKDVASYRKPAHLCDKCLMVFEEDHFITRFTNERPPFITRVWQHCNARQSEAALYVLDFWKVVLESRCVFSIVRVSHTEEEHIEPGTITFHELIYVRLHVREGDLQASYEAASDAGKLYEFLY